MRRSIGRLRLRRRGCDVLGFGIVTVDDQVYLDRFPAANTKQRVERTMRTGGGLTGSALVAASRLGASCSYAGVLGQDELSRHVLTEFKREGVACADLMTTATASPYHSIIVAARHDASRTILFSDKGVTPRPVASIDERLIAQSALLLVDHLGLDGMIKAATIARRLGIQVAADIERVVPGNEDNTDELVRLVDHLILPDAFARELSGAGDPESAVSRLHGSTKRVCTAVTSGESGCWFLSSESHDRVTHLPAFKVDAVDTVGCGDIFHGAYAACIVRGWRPERSIRFASAAAAMSAERLGGRNGCPSRAEVESFLVERDVSWSAQARGR